MAQKRTVAILVGSQALGALLCSVLSGHEGVVARAFSSESTLNIYLRLSPVDLVIADFDAVEAPADRVATNLRQSPHLEGLRFAVLALGRHLSAEIRDRAAASGIVEVIAKPVAPSYLRERVLARLNPPESPAIPAPPLRPQVALGQHRPASNVVALFPRLGGVPALRP